MTFLQIVGAFFVALFASVGASFIGYCTWLGLCQVWGRIRTERPVQVRVETKAAV